MRAIVLGCGPSQGVPTIGNNWGDCDPANPRNHRRRPSIVVEWDGFTILIDTSPDLRAQLIDADITHVDAVLYTHTHADHLHGIDDLRPVQRRMKTIIDAYGVPADMDRIVRRFSYLFQGQPPEDDLYRPILAAHAVDGPFGLANGREVVPLAQDHGICPSTGFRLGPLAYSTDVLQLPEETFAALDGVEVWIVDCLRVAPEHPTHAHLERTLSWIDRVGPARAVLTHMNHQTDYATLAALLPEGVEPGYDGMVIDIAE